MNFSVHGSPPIRALPSFPTRRSSDLVVLRNQRLGAQFALRNVATQHFAACAQIPNLLAICAHAAKRSEEHTSELQSRGQLVCRLLLEKKKNSEPLSTKTTLTCPLRSE